MTAFKIWRFKQVLCEPLGKSATVGIQNKIITDVHVETNFPILLNIANL